MQIKTPTGLLYLEDSDDRVTKIKKGHGHSFVDGELVVSDEQTGPDFSAILIKLEENRAHPSEIQAVLANLLRKHLDSGKI